jgi:sialate O-acetylesterase
VDIGDPGNIHPQNKVEVGRRLSPWALGTVYGSKVRDVSGPLSAGHTINGSTITVAFKHTDGGLNAKSGELKGFAVGGGDRQWQPAQAMIAGDTR